MHLHKDTVADLASRGFSRRRFHRVLTLLTAGAAMPAFNEASLARAQLSRLRRGLPPGAVKINANENPAGPAPAAMEALMAAARDGGRYRYRETYEMARAAAAQEGLSDDQILPYPGSSLGLHHAVISFVSTSRGLVTADPGYEAAARAAEFLEAPVKRVPLLEDGRHNIPAMVETARKMNAGVIYLCNPNNPTGVAIPRKQIDYVLANKPAGSIVLLDEAYIHFTGEPYASDLVKAGKDLIVLRTFSKIYGMAGLRAGFALSRPGLLRKMRGFFAGAMPSTGMAAARASIADEDLVPQRRKLTAEIRNDLFEFLDKRGYRHTPSVSTKFMIDVRMPVKTFIDRMAAQNVFVGRPWPAWPTWSRVSIGTAEEMEKFKKAFLHATGA